MSESESEPGHRPDSPDAGVGQPASERVGHDAEPARAEVRFEPVAVAETELAVELIGGVYLTRIGLRIDRNLDNASLRDVGLILGRSDAAVNWGIGDWLIATERAWGNRYDEAAEITGKTKSSLRKIKWVARAVPLYRRRYELSFEHHVAVAGFVGRDQEAWLDRAVDGGWTTKRLRDEIERSQMTLNLGPDLDIAPKDDPPVKDGEYHCRYCSRRIPRRTWLYIEEHFPKPGGGAVMFSETRGPRRLRAGITKWVSVPATIRRLEEDVAEREQTIAELKERLLDKTETIRYLVDRIDGVRMPDGRDVARPTGEPNQLSLDKGDLYEDVLAPLRSIEKAKA